MDGLGDEDAPSELRTAKTEPAANVPQPAPAKAKPSAAAKAKSAPVAKAAKKK